MNGEGTKNHQTSLVIKGFLVEGWGGGLGRGWWLNDTRWGCSGEGVRGESMLYLKADTRGCSKC